MLSANRHLLSCVPRHFTPWRFGRISPFTDQTLGARLMKAPDPDYGVSLDKKLLVSPWRPESPPAGSAGGEPGVSIPGPQQVDSDTVRDLAKKHTTFGWGASSPMLANALHAAKTKGCWIYVHQNPSSTDPPVGIPSESEPSLRKVFDGNAGAMCSNLGHTVDQTIIDAVTRQLQSLPYLYAGLFLTDARVELCTLLANMIEGAINHFYFPSTGAEANEAAIRFARVYTKRHKIFSRYRSYHGATTTMLATSGDFRRYVQGAERGASGHVHFLDPYPYGISYGASEADVTAWSLALLEEQIRAEGPETIAAIIVESVTGTNGILPQPRGYLMGLRYLCDQYGIVLICDEVMAGFCRTGRLFGYQACEDRSFVPDIVTFAKGVNGALLPLAGVGIHDKLAAYFDDHAANIGGTYNAHPVAVASAVAAVRVMIRDDILGNVQRVGAVMAHRMRRLEGYIGDDDDEIDRSESATVPSSIANPPAGAFTGPATVADNRPKRFPSVRQGRSLGLFGAIDFQRSLNGEFWDEPDGLANAAMQRFRRRLLEEGLFSMHRGHTLFVNPPLVATIKDIHFVFDVIERCLPILDAEVQAE